MENTLLITGEELVTYIHNCPEMQGFDFTGYNLQILVHNQPEEFDLKLYWHILKHIFSIVTVYFEIIFQIIIQTKTFSKPTNANQHSGLSIRQE